MSLSQQGGKTLWYINVIILNWQSQRWKKLDGELPPNANTVQVKMETIDLSVYLQAKHTIESGIWGLLRSNKQMFQFLLVQTHSVCSRWTVSIWVHFQKGGFLSWWSDMLPNGAEWAAHTDSSETYWKPLLTIQVKSISPFYWKLFCNEIQFNSRLFTPAGGWNHCWHYILTVESYCSLSLCGKMVLLIV